VTAASAHRPAVGAADLTAEVCLRIAVADPRRSGSTKTAATAPLRRDSDRQKRLAQASQASQTALRGSPLHCICVPMQLTRVPRG
jgi:hypothetical protein